MQKSKSKSMKNDHVLFNVFGKHRENNDVKATSKLDAKARTTSMSAEGFGKSGNTVALMPKLSGIILVFTEPMDTVKPTHHTLPQPNVSACRIATSSMSSNGFIWLDGFHPLKVCISLVTSVSESRSSHCPAMPVCDSILIHGVKTVNDRQETTFDSFLFGLDSTLDTPLGDPNKLELLRLTKGSPKLGLTNTRKMNCNDRKYKESPFILAQHHHF